MSHAVLYASGSDRASETSAGAARMMAAPSARAWKLLMMAEAAAKLVPRAPLLDPSSMRALTASALDSSDVKRDVKSVVAQSELAQVFRRPRAEAAVEAALAALQSADGPLQT